MFQVGTIVTLAKRCVSKGKLFVTKKVQVRVRITIVTLDLTIRTQENFLLQKYVKKWNSLIHWPTCDAIPTLKLEIITGKNRVGLTIYITISCYIVCSNKPRLNANKTSFLKSFSVFHSLPSFYFFAVMCILFHHVRPSFAGLMYLCMQNAHFGCWLNVFFHCPVLFRIFVGASLSLQLWPLLVIDFSGFLVVSLQGF